jgi:hypothetical protein
MEPLETVIDASKPVQDKHREMQVRLESEVGFVTVLGLKDIVPIDDDDSNGDLDSSELHSGCSYDVALGVLGISFLLAFLLAGIMSQVTNERITIYIGVICLVVIVVLIPLVLAYIDYRRKSSR